MGLFDEVAGGILKQVFSSSSVQNNLLQVITGYLQSSESGGLGGLVEQFKEKGLGDAVSSWVGTGENLPISAEQISQVLGNGEISRIAEQLGVSPEETSDGLAAVLPQVVDKLTPEGSVPSDDLLSQGLSLLADKFLGK
jgi:uncharacterized protein YidB (DUF937 family)